MIASRRPWLACAALLLAARSALAVSSDAEEDCVVDALAAEGPEDANSSCSFRQLRGDLLPSTVNKHAPDDADEASPAPLDGEPEVEVEGSDASLLDKSAMVPMVVYPQKYCRECAEMAFCQKASNPGCGGGAVGGVSSFANRQKGSGCQGVRPTLTIPKSYIENIDHLKKTKGGYGTLVNMLVSGFSTYAAHGGGKPPYWMCIHKSNSVSVRWLHLHTFCHEGKVDNLPNRDALCAKMYSTSQANDIASQLMR